MKHRSLTLTISILAVVAFIAIVLTLLWPSAAAAKNEGVTYDWMACDGILAGGDSCPNTAFASNGDKIQVTGQGELTDGTKEVSGGGTFVHMDSDGNVLGAGTWVATELLNFKTYGPGVGVPADFRTGTARMRVDLMVGGNKVAEGIITIGCRLPGVKLPPAVFEGINLNILGGINFNKLPTTGDMPPGGVTLFLEK